MTKRTQIDMEETRQQDFNQNECTRVTPKGYCYPEDNPFGLLALHGGRHTPVAIDLQGDLADNQAKKEHAEEIRDAERCRGKEACDGPVDCPHHHEQAGPMGNEPSVWEHVKKEAYAQGAEEGNDLGEQWPRDRRTRYWHTLNERKHDQRERSQQRYAVRRSTPEEHDPNEDIDQQEDGVHANIEPGVEVKGDAVRLELAYVSDRELGAIERNGIHDMQIGKVRREAGKEQTDGQGSNGHPRDTGQDEPCSLQLCL